MMYSTSQLPCLQLVLTAACLRSSQPFHSCTSCYVCNRPFYNRDTLVISITPLLWISHSYFECNALLAAGGWVRGRRGWLLQITHVWCFHRITYQVKEAYNIKVSTTLSLELIYPVNTGCFKPVRNRFQLLSGLIEVSVNAPKSISKRLESNLNRFL